MPTRKLRVIKQGEQPNNDQSYVDRHEKSLIALLVPKHIDYARRLIKEAETRDDIFTPRLKISA